MPPIPLQSGIYCWRNKVNNKIYIGSTSNFKQRFRDYRGKLPRNKCHNPYLQNAWNKYGADNFELLIIERCEPEILLERETEWIHIMNATDDKYGYNICSVGGSTLGYNHTDEAKQKMSEAKKLLPPPRLGAVLTQETKDKISASKKGKKMTDEAKQKMSASRKGRKLSPEHTVKCKTCHWSKGPNAAIIAEKIRIARTGKTHTDATKAKISATKLGTTE